MTEQQPSPIDDRQLDDLLRDVPIPEDLEARLKRIPRPDQVEAAPPTNNPWRKAGWLTGLAIAAALTGVVAWLALPAGERPEPVADAEPVVELQPGVESLPNEDSDSAVAPAVPDPPGQPAPREPGPPALASSPLLPLDRLAGEIESLRLQVEMMQQRRQLTRLRRQNTTGPRPGAAPGEVRSLMAYQSEHSALAWGASPESVRVKMANIIELYPDTEGARQAQQFLASTTNGNSSIQ